MQKESNDPTKFQISLLLNGNPAPNFEAFTLDFNKIKSDHLIVSSSDPKAPKFQAGYVKIVIGLVTTN
jgi:hypothetical protein